MAFSAGTRLGPYEVLSALGAGGMGEVYKARDARLDRIVAIKILPSTDPALRLRFEREARAIAALQHSHICALYDVGHDNETDYLILEYVEGETLADRLRRGPLKLDEALKTGIEIADALDRAHRVGITHRDLKPGNIMLTRSGVKLLDFGLAKLQESGALDGLSAAPTHGTPMTARGTILGTLQYMAPEQVEGKDVDGRSDIFALGAVLFEMVTGRRAFDGGSQATVIAAILDRDPPAPSSLQPLSPPFLDHIVQRCLAKDPDERWQSARDVMLELKSLTGGMSVNDHRAASMRRWSWTLLVSTVAASLLIALVALWNMRSPSAPAAQARGARFSLLPPEHTTFLGGYTVPYLAMSPDGATLAFIPTPIGGRTLLWIRPIDSLVARPLPGTDGASFPFWSPDSRRVAFFADGKLKTIDVNGDAPHVICDAPDGRGGAWGSDGSIVLSPLLNSALYQVSADGGQLAPLTTLDASRLEVSHRLPSFLPDGRHFLFLIQSGKNDNQVLAIGSLDSKEIRRLTIRASKAVYVPPGYLLYGRDQSLTAQPFDASRFELSGEPISLGERVAFRSGIFGDYAFAAAADGTLAIWSGGESLTDLTWFDRMGKSLGSLGSADYLSLDLSPDGRKVAAEIEDPATQLGSIWMIDVATRIRSRFTFGTGWDFNPVWSSDGTRLLFGSIRFGQQNLYVKSANGGADDHLLDSSDGMGPSDWSSDGQLIVYHNLSKERVEVLSLRDERRTQTAVTQSGFVAGDGHLSPDRRWLAYSSNESGAWDVYVQPFPSLDRKWRISPAGGSRPHWRADGKELFYINRDQDFMAVSVNTGPTFEPGAPVALFHARTLGMAPTQPRAQYAVTAKGDRFLINTVVEPPMPSPITIILNWTAALKQSEN